MTFLHKKRIYKKQLHCGTQMQHILKIMWVSAFAGTNEPNVGNAEQMEFSKLLSSNIYWCSEKYGK